MNSDVLFYEIRASGWPCAEPRTNGRTSFCGQGLLFRILPTPLRGSSKSCSTSVIFVHETMPCTPRTSKFTPPLWIGLDLPKTWGTSYQSIRAPFGQKPPVASIADHSRSPKLQERILLPSLHPAWHIGQLIPAVFTLIPRTNVNVKHWVSYFDRPRGANSSMSLLQRKEQTTTSRAKVIPLSTQSWPYCYFALAIERCLRHLELGGLNRRTGDGHWILLDLLDSAGQCLLETTV